MEKNKEAFERLLKIMNDLREKCPWDKKQTLHSLRPLTIEETYELADAILKEDWGLLKEELGDIMLHLVFYAKIAEEKNEFTIVDVLESLCEKLIRRHPHIYGEIMVSGEEDVKKNWEQIKMKEGKESVLSGVPGGLPSMIKALRIQDKAAQVGFEWKHTEDVWKKVLEEMNELQEEVAADKQAKIEEEFGDLLFALMNYARFIDVDPDAALERCNQKFIYRFQYIEKQAKAQSLSLNQMTLEEMDALWNEAKKSG